MLGMEAGQEQVGFSQGRGDGRLSLCPGAGAGRVRLQGGAETHPDRVGGPVGPSGRRGRGGREAAGSDHNQLVPSALPSHRLGGVESAAEETICGGEDALIGNHTCLSVKRKKNLQSVLPISSEEEVDKLVLMIKWSEVSTMSYTLSPCATRSTCKKMHSCYLRHPS